MYNPHAEFISYMLGFYGEAGIYPESFTADEVMHATLIRIERIGINKFEADSIDREAVRDIILDEIRPSVIKVNIEEYTR